MASYFFVPLHSQTGEYDMVRTQITRCGDYFSKAGTYFTGSPSPFRTSAKV